MSASLVGSEMCIRDSPRPPAAPRHVAAAAPKVHALPTGARAKGHVGSGTCLLYTSDAADDM
eukprot:2162667-Alexandrium_andersonii.AAC.1